MIQYRFSNLCSCCRHSGQRDASFPVWGSRKPDASNVRLTNRITTQQVLWPKQNALVGNEGFCIRNPRIGEHIMANPTWSAVGPAPQHNGNAAYSGRANAFAVSANFNGAGTRALFVATDGGGVWRAVPFTGPSPIWQPLTDEVPTAVANRSGLSAIVSVSADPHNPQVIYAGSAAGILRSQDGGNSWALIPGSPTSATKIIVDPRIGGTAVWAGSSLGLFISANGLNWIQTTIGGWGFTSFSVDDLEWIVSADLKSLTLYAAVHDTAANNDGSRNGIYVTVNEGGIWNKTAINPINRENGQLVLPPNFGSITLGADHTPGSAVPPVAAISKKDPDWRHAILLNVFKLLQGTWTPIGAGLPTGLDTQGGANQPITVTLPVPSILVYRETIARRSSSPWTAGRIGGIFRAPE